MSLVEVYDGSEKNYPFFFRAVVRLVWEREGVYATFARFETLLGEVSHSIDNNRNTMDDNADVIYGTRSK